MSLLTGAPTAWNPGADDDVHALALSGSTLYVGGSFDRLGGRTRNGIAALSTRTGRVRAWNPNAEVSGTRLYVGGFFTSLGGRHRNGIAALDARSGAAAAWNPKATDLADTADGGAPGEDPGDVSALALSGSTVYAGGGFDQIGGRERNGIAALNARSGTATGWNPNPDADGGATALAVSRRRVYAGGSFPSIADGLGETLAIFAP